MSPARAGTSAVAAALGAAGLLLVLVTWAASIGPERVVQGGEVDQVRPTPTATATASDDGSTEPDLAADARDAPRGSPPGWLRTVALVLELLTLGVVLYLVGRLLRSLRRAWRVRVRRRRRGPAPVEFEVLDSATEVAEAIEEDAPAQRVLLEEGEARNAVVACWDRFEQQAARARVVRKPWQTTAEFVLGVLDLVDAEPAAVSRLADLYREARFSDHPMTEEHRRAALEALDAIHAAVHARLGPRRPVPTVTNR